MAWTPVPYTATAVGLAAATGPVTSVDAHTMTYVRQGILSAATAQASASAQGEMKPTAEAFADTLAIGGNINVGMSAAVGGMTKFGAYKSTATYSSSQGYASPAVELQSTAYDSNRLIDTLFSVVDSATVLTA
jgi:hypothetical protein